ncbi:MAG: PEP-CTERM sorting domain-containing protein [Deltaproteobacteria bacterium]|nr:PEP-CTERM sorting domain-containing protein [Deltaproteobacteria bacterium]
MPERLGNPGKHVAASDWLFIGEDVTPPQNIPEPGSLALLGSGLAAGLARRRKARR